MAKIYGLDFGTTNSLASIVLDDVDEKMLSLVNEDDRMPHPSVIRYHGNEVVVGRAAKNAIETTDVGVIGDFVRSPKRYLGSGEKIHVGGVARSVSDVVAEILRHVRDDARQHREINGETFERAVMTIPINAVGRARRDLREAALKAGLHIHQFVQEPFAALYGYLRSLSGFQRRLAELEGQIVLVFDWGGGTLDLTLCKITKGMLVQIQSKGDNTVGGDRFDDRLIRYAKNEHMKQYSIDSVANEFPHAEAKLIAQCETAKIALSDRSSIKIGVRHYLKSDGPDHSLEVKVTREKLIELTRDIVDAGMKNIDEILESTGVNQASIALCLATGGMVRMPYIRERLLERFDPLRVPKIDDGDRIISQGAAWIGHDGVRLTLAKPFELLLGNDNYSTLISEGTELPIENQNFAFPFKAYCIDPRDGYGKFQFARPVWPDRNLPGDPRRSYATLLVAVDEEAAPLTERLNINVNIDHDLVVTVTASSSMVGHLSEREIHNLEFGLSMGQGVKEQTNPDNSNGQRNNEVNLKREVGAIKFRSNIVRGDQSWDLVPGDLVKKYRNRLPPLWEPTRRQHDEKMYYVPCTYCKRTWYQIRLEGSENCTCSSGSVKEMDAKAQKAKISEWQDFLRSEESVINDTGYSVVKGADSKGIQ
ncbi:Hsp70 family protein [Nitrosococcus wardiae]|uniref:Hsp70 family protein n=1 Tax=Nitrosococcus wardiae TaxID=1814290 RepID=A0A4P7BV16_9GAMM|nr:Hsp70 family protein [Nitrosococcus wardiae]QBQ53823.1 Hsp70 family protein [Nitrosococcus wardiae]